MYWFKAVKMKILIYVCLSFFLLPAANAYILKGEHVLQLMIETIHFPKRLAVHQQIAFSDSGIEPETINLEYEQWVRYQMPEEFRSDIDAEDLKQIQIVSSDNSLTVIDERIVSGSQGWEDHYKDIFFYRSRKQMVEKLESLGIDFSVTSLGRYNGEICFVLGAEYPDESVPQLWVAKDTFQPVRWIFEITEGMGVVEQKEIRYGDWKMHYKSRYPSKIDFYRGQNLFQRISVLGVEINPSFPDDMFDIEKLRMFYLTMNPEETDPTEQNDIEKRIEEFNRIYE
jgi:outer membrane lipoprotein-sorting protein